MSLLTVCEIFCMGGPVWKQNNMATVILVLIRSDHRSAVYLLEIDSFQEAYKALLKTLHNSKWEGDNTLRKSWAVASEQTNLSWPNRRAQEVGYTKVLLLKSVQLAKLPGSYFQIRLLDMMLSWPFIGILIKSNNNKKKWANLASRLL